MLDIVGYLHYVSSLISDLHMVEVCFGASQESFEISFDPGRWIKFLGRIVIFL